MLNKQYNKKTQYTFSCPANDKKAKEQTKKHCTYNSFVSSS